MAVVGLITHNDKSEYLQEVENLEIMVSNLSISLKKKNKGDD